MGKMEKMGKWENEKMGKWENRKMRKWENGKMRKWEKENNISNFLHSYIIVKKFCEAILGF